MDPAGQEVIAQTQQRVWVRLNDPGILKARLSGSEEIGKAGGNSEVGLNAVVGPVKAWFTEKLLLSNLDPMSAYSLAFEGIGGAAGFSKGGANAQPFAVGEATKSNCEADGKMGGKIAQVGSRLVDGVALRIASDIFAPFNELAVTPGPVAAPVSQVLVDTSARAGLRGAVLPRWNAVSAVAGSPWMVILSCAALAAADVLTRFCIWIAEVAKPELFAPCEIRGYRVS